MTTDRVPTVAWWCPGVGRLVTDNHPDWCSGVKHDPLVSKRAVVEWLRDNEDCSNVTMLADRLDSPDGLNEPCNHPTYVTETTTCQKCGDVTEVTHDCPIHGMPVIEGECPEC